MSGRLARATRWTAVLARGRGGPGGPGRVGQAVVLPVLALALVSCAGTPPPGWALDARAAMQATVVAALEGDARLEAAEFERAKAQLGRTGRTDLLARAELMRCAAHAARLDLGPCEGFESRRVDALPADRAYADYLNGRLADADAALLPDHHRALSQRGEVALPGLEDPLGRLVGAAVLLRAGRAGPATVQAAVDTASAQGWRRALLAWLGVQRRLAEQAGDAAEVQRLQRRIDAASTASR